MENKIFRPKVRLVAIICLGIVPGNVAIAHSLRTLLRQQPPAQTPALARSVGTIKSISGNTITLATDAGADVTILVQDTTQFARIAPGQKDLKDAIPIQLQDVQPGDRLLVRGKLAGDGESVLAVSVIAMKKADIAGKQARECEEWRSHGIDGLVGSVDTAGNTILIVLPVLGEKKNIAIRLSKDTLLRRYAPGSVKFDDARPAPLDQIKPGDQLRARGKRNADGKELIAEEIVSGTFRNIAGTISALDPSAGVITVQDSVSRTSITAKIAPDSQLRKLPLPMAQRIAMRLKGISAGAPEPARSVAANAGQSPGPGGPPDLQQAINRMPAATLSDLQKGDAVMIVATEGAPNELPTVITLLGGVEPILEVSPKSNASTILTPWNLDSASGGEAATP